MSQIIAKNQSWREVLRRVSPKSRATEAARRRATRAYEAIPEELFEKIADSIGEWWPLRPRKQAGLQVVLVHPDGRRQKIALFQRVIRIGRDASNHIQLAADTVSSRHCEIRFDDDRLWLVDLSSSNGTKLNGYELEPYEPRPLTSRDKIELRPFRLVVGSLSERFEDPESKLKALAVRWRPQPPLDSVGGDALWFKARGGKWQGWIRLPESWLTWAWRALDQDPPTPITAERHHEVDMAVTSYLLGRIGSSVEERTGFPVSLSSLQKLEDVDLPVDASGWLALEIELSLGSKTFMVDVIWPETQSAEPDQDSSWLADLPFEISVLAGRLKLAPQDLKSIDPGDILMPDTWWPTDWIEQPEGSLGPVRLRLQSWNRPADLRFEKGFYHLSLGRGWQVAPLGEPMTDDQTVQTNLEDETLGVPDELEVTVAFELERLSVPLKELTAWQEGQTLQLRKTPEDPVRILLLQGSGPRVLGYGRVVVVEDRLGLQIDRWLVNKDD